MKCNNTDNLGQAESPVVYGTDDRMDVYAHPNATLRARAQQATVALMSPSAINTQNPNNVTFNAQTLQQSYNLCQGQRFLSDPTPAVCSGTLIDDNLEAIRAQAREYGVARLEVFGSVCTPDFDPEQSDVDFLVKYPEGYDFGPWLRRRHELRRTLEAVVGRSVDLVEMSALRDPDFAGEADLTRSVIYDAAAITQVA